MAMVLIGAGAAWAGQFPALDAGIKQARDRTPVINARLAAEQYAINQRYNSSNNSGIWSGRWRPRRWWSSQWMRGASFLNH